MIKGVVVECSSGSVTDNLEECYGLAIRLNFPVVMHHSSTQTTTVTREGTARYTWTSGRANGILWRWGFTEWKRKIVAGDYAWVETWKQETDNTTGETKLVARDGVMVAQPLPDTATPASASASAEVKL